VDRLTQILDDFPAVDGVHPFYADLLNVLYDRDHYKLALGGLAGAKALVSRIASDYVRLLKYGDSLYRCKELKRAALGRMATLMKRQSASLAYLEQVRQHMGRLPAIDPGTRTLLVCGYPNVGKSSFVNSVTRADVDVQPYAFTTKALYVGHCDHRYLRWQVIDTPGILDRPLEARNTIEMQAVTALAHLRAAVLYVLDPSGACGHSLAEQAALFHSIKPLFAGKPLLVVANKADTAPLEGLTPEERALVDDMAAEAARVSGGPAAAAAAEAGSGPTPTVLSMSTLTGAGVAAVKAAACDALLAARVEAKLAGRRAPAVAARLHVAVPRTPPPAGTRAPHIPASVLAARASASAAAGTPLASTLTPRRTRTERHAQEEAGGAGAYAADWTAAYKLANPAWARDVVPEIWDGKNVADFIDPDVDARLAALEAEEDAAAAAYEGEAAAAAAAAAAGALAPEEAATLAAIRVRKATLVAAHRQRKATAGNRPVMPRTVEGARVSKVPGAAALSAAGLVAGLGRTGLDAGRALERAGRERSSRSVSRLGRKRERSASAARAASAEAAAGEKKRIHSSKSRSMSRGRSLSVAAPAAGSGLRDAAQRNTAIKKADRAQRRPGKMARKGEGDRHIPDLMPKHLFSGKRGKGKTDRR